MKIVSRKTSGTLCELGACKMIATAEIIPDEKTERGILICEDCLKELRKEISRFFAKADYQNIKKAAEKE